MDRCLRSLLLRAVAVGALLWMAAVARGQIAFTEVMYEPGGTDALWGTGKLVCGVAADHLTG